MNDQLAAISIKNLFESHCSLHQGYSIKKSRDTNTGQCFYDLLYEGNIVCMDGEICKIIKVNELGAILENVQSVVNNHFFLNRASLKFCIFASTS